MSRVRLDAEQVQRNFSRQAGQYDRYAAVQRRVIDRLLQLLLEGGPVAGPALEIGAGTGRLSRRLTQICPGVRPVLSDLAHAMTCRAAVGLPGRPAFDADAQALPLRTGTMSLVVSSSVYQWVADLPHAFAESARVLRPGGRFAFALFGAGTLGELRDCHRRALAETGGGRSSHMQEFPSAIDVQEALDRAGFIGSRLLSAQEWEFHDDLADLLGSLKRIGAGNAAENRPSGLAGRRTMRRLAELYEEYRRDGRLPATYRVIYGLARKPSGRP
ncbi:MAG: methyltransferase domain-containing protein [Desulfuromonadales bacterium]